MLLFVHIREYDAQGRSHGEVSITAAAGGGSVRLTYVADDRWGSYECGALKTLFLCPFFSYGRLRLEFRLIQMGEDNGLAADPLASI